MEFLVVVSVLLAVLSLLVIVGLLIGDPDRLFKYAFRDPKISWKLFLSKKAEDTEWLLIYYIVRVFLASVCFLIFAYIYFYWV